MQDNLMINNMYAAYTATSKGTEKNIGEITKMLREKNQAEEKASDVKELLMDKIMLSAKAVEMMRESAAQL